MHSFYDEKQLAALKYSAYLAQGEEERRVRPAGQRGEARKGFHLRFLRISLEKLGLL